MPPISSECGYRAPSPARSPPDERRNPSPSQPPTSSESDMTVRVLIADDQQLVRTGFRLILETEEDIKVVAEAANGREAVQLARKLQPDVVLMDIRMPELDGIEATRELAAPDRQPPTRVLILTTFDLDEYVFDALRAGASGLPDPKSDPE